LNKYILIGVKERRDLEFENSMQETMRLMQASDLEVVFRLEQATLNNNPSYLKKGKLDEVKAALINLEADGVVCNDALSPSQYRNLSEYLDTNVIDRTQLILEIFEKRAKQKESKRNKRNKNETLTIALVGYTNAGKSSLLNWFMEHYSTPDKKVSAQDRLFESLETSSRNIELDGYPIILIDTVGFVSRLPHHLVKAFRSTLEIVKDADLILHVLDGSSDNMEGERDVTLNTLKELECENTPRIEIRNKMDLRESEGLNISITKDMNMNLMLDAINQKIRSIRPITELLIPYDEVNILDHIKKMYTIQSIYEEKEGYRIQLSYVKQLNKQLKSYERKPYDTQHNPKH